MGHSANCKQQVKEKEVKPFSLMARKVVILYCCHGTEETEKAAFQHQNMKRDAAETEDKRHTERFHSPGLLEPTRHQEGRKAFKSGRSWKGGEGEEVRAPKEKVFSTPLVDHALNRIVSRKIKITIDQVSKVVYIILEYF